MDYKLEAGVWRGKVGVRRAVTFLTWKTLSAGWILGMTKEGIRGNLLN